MTYKYVSIGMNMLHTSGKVSYFHDECALHFNAMLGTPAKKTDDAVPKAAKCPWCGKLIEGLKQK